MQKFEETKHLQTSLMAVLTSLTTCQQGNNEKVGNYMDKLSTLAETYKHHGGRIAKNSPQNSMTRVTHGQPQ